MPTLIPACPLSKHRPFRPVAVGRTNRAVVAATFLLGSLGVLAGSARAQQSSQEKNTVATGTATNSNIKIDRMFDLNGDGVIDEHERELAIQYMFQSAYLDANGRPDKAKIRAALAQRKKLEAEQRLLDDEQDLLAKRAQGKALSGRDETKLKQAAEIRARRQQERELAKRNAATAPQSAAAQKLAKPMVDY